MCYEAMLHQELVASEVEPVRKSSDKYGSNEVDKSSICICTISDKRDGITIRSIFIWKNKILRNMQYPFRSMGFIYINRKDCEQKTIIVRRTPA